MTTIVPTSFRVMFTGDSIMHGAGYGADPIGGAMVNENDVVSPRGYVIAALRALGYAITSVGTSLSANALRNGLPDQASNACGGATLGPDSNFSGGQYNPPLANNIWNLINKAYAEGVTPDVIYLEGGANNFFGNGNGAGPAPAEFEACVNVALSLWPSVKILMIGTLPSTGFSSSTTLALRTKCAALANGTNKFYLDPYVVSGLDVTTYHADTYDGTHLTVAGAQKLTTNMLVPLWNAMIASYSAVTPGDTSLPPETGWNGNWYTKTNGTYRGRWDDKPSITTTALPSSVFGGSYSFQCVGSAGTWSASGLPAGQSISSSGLITASNVTGATSTVTLTLTTPNGRVATATMQSVVASNVGLSTTSLTNGVEGVAGSQSVSMTGPGTLTVTATGLPAGATLTTGGSLSWTTGILSGIYALRFTVTSSTAGAGTPVVLPWTVTQTAIVDDGAWSPLLRRRLA